MGGTNSSQYSVVAEKVKALHDEGFVVVPPLSGLSLGTFGYFNEDGKFCMLGHLKTFLDPEGEMQKLLKEILPSETGKSAQIKAVMGFKENIVNTNRVKVNVQTGLPIEIGTEVSAGYEMDSASSVLLSTMSLTKLSIVSPSTLIYKACKSGSFKKEAREHYAEINSNWLTRIFAEKHLHIVTDVLRAKDGIFLMTTSKNSQTSFSASAIATCTQVQGYGKVDFAAASSLEHSLSAESDFVIAIKTKRFYHDRVSEFTDADLAERLAQLDLYFATGEKPMINEIREEVEYHPQRVPAAKKQIMGSMMMGRSAATADFTNFAGAEEGSGVVRRTYTVEVPDQALMQAIETTPLPFFEGCSEIVTAKSILQL